MVRIHIALPLVAALLTTPALAGNVLPPPVEPPIIVEDTVAESHGILVPIFLVTWMLSVFVGD